MKDQAKLYYTPPSDEIFEEMKGLAREIWDNYDDDFGYATEKKECVDIKNIGDNFMYILAMFDINNQKKLLRVASPELRQAVRERLAAGGMNEAIIDSLIL